MVDRRSFLKLSPAFPVGTVTAALLLREKGKEDITLDVSVLQVQAGDVLVLTAPYAISQDEAIRLKAYIESVWPNLTALVMGNGLKLDGVIRTA